MRQPLCPAPLDRPPFVFSLRARVAGWGEKGGLGISVCLNWPRFIRAKRVRSWNLCWKELGVGPISKLLASVPVGLARTG